jgi:hypothetical protein
VALVERHKPKAPMVLTLCLILSPQLAVEEVQQVRCLRDLADPEARAEVGQQTALAVQETLQPQAHPKEITVADPILAQALLTLQAGAAAALEEQEQTEYPLLVEMAA